MASPRLNISLSVRNLSPIAAGNDAAQTLRNRIDLARDGNAREAGVHK